MLEEWRRFNSKITDANPAPYDETASYKKFMMWFPPASLAAYVAVSYVVTLLLEQKLVLVSRFIEMQIPILSNRVSYIGGAESISAHAFSATILTGLALTPLVMMTQWNGYWRSGIDEREFSKVGLFSAIFILRGMAILMIFIWIAFVDTPASGKVARVGMAGIFSWPIFPAIGSAIIWMAAGLFFCGLIGLTKALISHRRK